MNNEIVITHSINNKKLHELKWSFDFSKNNSDKTIYLKKDEISDNVKLNELNIDHVVGKEKELLRIIFNFCQLTGMLETPLLTSECLTNMLEINSTHLRNIIFRLVTKGFIYSINVKNGSSRKFKISQEIFNQFFESGKNICLKSKERENELLKQVSIEDGQYFMPSFSEFRLLQIFKKLKEEEGCIIIRRSQIANAIGLTVNGIKTALQRLKSKGFITLLAYSKGQHTGCTSYDLTPQAYKLLSAEGKNYK